MNVLLTGATGFVGANLLHTLVQSSNDVHIILRRTSDTWRISEVLSKVESHYCDLEDNEQVRKAVSEVMPSTIFHLAMYGGYPHQKDLAKTINTNLLGTINLLEACIETGFECFVNTGSSSEYGHKTDPMVETDIPEPLDEYGVTKVASTLYCQSAGKKHNLRIFTLRLFSPYGYFEYLGRLVPYVISHCVRNEQLELSNPDIVRDFVFIEDVVDAFLKVAEKANQIRPGEIFNVGSGEQHTVKEVYDIVKGLTSYRKEPHWGKLMERPYNSTRTWKANIDKIRNTTGWIPRTTLLEGLSKTTAWFRDRLEKQERIQGTQI